jgi:type VI secretion system ImpM family protein
MNWPWRRTPSLQPTAALLGKLPSRPDFVREAAQGRAADALDAWLVQAAPLLHAADGTGVSHLPVCWFGHWTPKQTSALVGVLGPSRDSAGREFPVAVFREFALGDRRKHFAALLSEHAGFLDAAQTLLAALPNLSLDEIRARLVSLPIPVQGTAPEIEPLQAGSRLQHLFETDPPGSLFYALSTFVSAFAGADATTQLAVDCPVRDAADARVWLALAAQLSVQNPACPSFLFAPEPARLLISVAAPGAELLCALAQPGFNGVRVWPLTTAHQPAIEHARNTLLPMLPELATEHGSSLSVRELGERLARAGAALAV